MVKTMSWENEKLILLNQTLLPNKVEFIKCNNYQRVKLAIQRLEVRGAPAIGAAAAFAMFLAFKEIIKNDQSINFNLEKFKIVKKDLDSARPTAINLEWATNLMVNEVKNNLNLPIELLKNKLLSLAIDVYNKDIENNKKMALNGVNLIPENARILTHCNAGALATCGIGTALGVIREAHLNNKIDMVYVDETRPLLQGARLTAWELMEDNIPTTLITDNMAAWTIKTKKIDLVIVGADRIALNGDVANKIGTYNLAILAKLFKIPFYVAAPLSTFDFTLSSGDKIPIEERKKEEVLYIKNELIAPSNAKVFNPAFDVTPNDLVSGIITEHSIIKPPYSKTILDLQQIKGDFKC